MNWDSFDTKMLVVVLILTACGTVVALAGKEDHGTSFDDCRELCGAAGVASYAPRWSTHESVCECWPPVPERAP